MTEIGHNSTQAFYDRLLSLETQRREIASDISDLKKEMNGAGEDAAAMAKRVKESFETQTAKAKRTRTEEMLELYRQAVGA